jgi:hypothetical protein
MRRLLLVAALMLILVTVVGVAFAQKDCGDGLPCGKLLWDLPVLPVLPSPTPMPTIQITAIPTNGPVPTGTGAATATTAPTGTIQADFSSIGNNMNTLAAAMNATSIPVMVSGTPVSPGSQLTTLSADAGSFFGYVRGFSEVSLGGWSSFIGLLMLSLTIVVGIKALGFILPVGAVIFRLILRIVEFVKNLIGL